MGSLTEKPRCPVIHSTPCRKAGEEHLRGCRNFFVNVHRELRRLVSPGSPSLSAGSPLLKRDERSFPAKPPILWGFTVRFHGRI